MLYRWNDWNVGHASNGPVRLRDTGHSPLTSQMMKNHKKVSRSEAFLALRDEERERRWREFDKPFIADTSRPLAKAQRALWEKAKRKPGRPRRGAGAKTISLTVERSLLKRADKEAKRRHISRAQLVALGLYQILPG